MQRKRSNLYKPESDEPFNISRSKIALFLECPQCFWLDRKCGISRPDMPGWSLNSAVDNLLKNEFDLLREQQQPHRLMQAYNIDAVPFSHPSFHIWRDDHEMEVYQWIFKQMGFPVSDTGYFFFANGNKNRPGFHGKLEFETSIIPYRGDISWIEPVILNIKKCLDSEEIPESGRDCQHCAYRKLISKQSLKTQISLI